MAGGAILCMKAEHEHTYQGRRWRFSVHAYLGATPLRLKDGEPFRRIPATFWPAFDDWAMKQDRE